MTTLRARPRVPDERPQGWARPGLDRRRRRQEEPAGTPHQDLGASEALPKLLTTAGAVIAPTTAVTALLLYFGRQHANAFFGYFGVNFTALDLTPTDFLVRSADGLFIPIAVAAAALLLALWAHTLVLYRLTTTTARRILRFVAPAAGLLGAGFVGFAAVLAVTHGGLRDAVPPESGGLALAIGVVLLLYAVRLARELWNRRLPSGVPRIGGTGLAEWATAFVLVTVGLFWAVTSYAAGVGRGRAMQLRDVLPAWPDAVVFSEQRLNLDVTGVAEVACDADDAAYRFRYDGLKLVQQAGDHYLLLPATWTPALGAAVLLPRTDAVRLEFVLAGQNRPAGC